MNFFHKHERLGKVLIAVASAALLLASLLPILALIH